MRPLKTSFSCHHCHHYKTYLYPWNCQVLCSSNGNISGYKSLWEVITETQLSDTSLDECMNIVWLESSPHADPCVLMVPVGFEHTTFWSSGSRLTDWATGDGWKLIVFTWPSSCMAVFGPAECVYYLLCKRIWICGDDFEKSAFAEKICRATVADRSLCKSNWKNPHLRSHHTESVLAD